MGKNQLLASRANRSWQRKPGDGAPLADDSLLQVDEWWKGSTFHLGSGRRVWTQERDFLVYPLPHQGFELGSADPRLPASERGTPPRPGRASRNGEPGGRRAPKVARRAQGGSRRPSPGPPHSPPGLPGRSPPSWRRPCRRSAPPAPPVAPAAAAALGPPCRSRLGLATRARTACLHARSPACPSASRSPRGRRRARALARRLAGGCWLRRRSRPLAGWLHTQWRAPRSRRERTGGAAGERAGREDATTPAQSERPAGRRAKGGGAAQP